MNKQEKLSEDDNDFLVQSVYTRNPIFMSTKGLYMGCNKDCRNLSITDTAHLQTLNPKPVLTSRISKHKNFDENEMLPNRWSVLSSNNFVLCNLKQLVLFYINYTKSRATSHFTNFVSFTFIIGIFSHVTSTYIL